MRSAVTRVEPRYPVLARAARISGAVVIEVTIDEQGNVIDTQVITGHPLLRNAALNAARGWKFSPDKVYNKPVKVIGPLTFNFHL
jgi:protein TonB